MRHKESFIRRRGVLVALSMTAGLTLVSPLENKAAPSVQVTQQSNVVKGKVVDDAGEPIIGAIIREVNGKANAVSDLDGNFTISAPVGSSLDISLLGYKAQRVKVTSGQLKVTLAEATQSLNDVVVVGFGKQKKADLTGAVAVVDGDELKDRPVTSAAEALQGAVPGLQISSSSGSLDGTPSINIRGVGTIGQGSSGSPLILIDGSEGDINSINSQDIESISVLKDAAASSIYGARAPFGVILITTKSGKNGGKVTVNYNNSFRIKSLINRKKMMNSVDFASFQNDCQVNTGNAPFFNDERMKEIVAYHNGKEIGPGTRETSMGILYGIGSSNGQTWDDGYAAGIDDVEWYGKIFKESTFSQEHNASVRGGFEKGNYYASFSFLDNGGFMKLADDNYKRYNGTAKMSIDITKWLTMTYNMRYVRTNYKRPSQMTDGLYNDLLRQGWPILPFVDRNGYYYSAPSWAMPLATRGQDRWERDIINQAVNFDIEPIKNWVTHVDFNYRTTNTIRHWDLQYGYNHDVNGNPVIRDDGSNVHEDENKDNYLNFQAYSEYTWDFAKKHNFHVMAGFQTEQLKNTNFGAQRDGVILPEKSEIDLTSGLSYRGDPITPSVFGRRNQWQTAGFFGRLNYNYMERYLFEANLRYDGTSRFRTDKMWKWFPSFSFGWRVTEEKFMKDVKWLSNLKLRLSYGSLGNQNTNNWYQTYQTISYNSAAGNWILNGSKPNTTSAPGLISTTLTWETIESYDAGLDFGFFNNRLYGSADFYVRNTKDMVGNAPELPAILGTGVPVTNNTNLRTTGWEIQVGWRDRLANGFSYSASLNLSDATTTIKKYPNNPSKSLDTYIEGRKLGDIWGWETIGIAKSQEEMDAHLAKVDQSTIGSNWTAGDLMYADLNGDGKISRGSNTLDDHGDLKVIGNNTPRYFFGVNLSGSWKGFDLSLFFQGLLKHNVWPTNATQWLFGSWDTWGLVGITDVQDYYRDASSWSVANGYEKENKNAWYPRPVQSDKNRQCQSRYLINGAYMRLKNLQFGYTIPRNITQKAGISNLRVFFSGENLFTITDCPRQFDPETIGTDGPSANGYPLQKTFSFGLNVTF